MTASLPLVVLISVLSALVTVFVAGFVVRRFLDRRLAAAGDELADRIRAAVEEGAESVAPKIRDAVRTGLDESVESALPTVRDEVAAGVRDGAESVIPAVRDEVKRGVEEAIASAVTGGVVEKAGEELARRGTSVLNRILGGPEER
jgi:uncharacterized membrane protein YraQ (UPF0718 family)